MSQANLPSTRKDHYMSGFAASGSSEMEQELREAMQQSYSNIIQSPLDSSQNMYKDSLRNPSLALTSSFHMI